VVWDCFSRFHFLDVFPRNVSAAQTHPPGADLWLYASKESHRAPLGGKNLASGCCVLLCCNQKTFKVISCAGKRFVPARNLAAARSEARVTCKSFCRVQPEWRRHNQSIEYFIAAARHPGGIKREKMMMEDSCLMPP
jgi:hypothetical protein